MTNDEIRIAVAECCGWEPHPSVPPHARQMEIGMTRQRKVYGRRSFTSGDVDYVIEQRSSGLFIRQKRKSKWSFVPFSMIKNIVINQQEFNLNTKHTQRMPDKMNITERIARLRACAESFPQDSMPEVRDFMFTTADCLTSLSKNHTALINSAKAAARSGDLETLRAALKAQGHDYLS